MADWITGAVTSIAGIVQAGIGAKKFREGRKQFDRIPHQDAESLSLLDTIKRKRIGIGSGTGTRYSVMQRLIENSKSLKEDK